MKKLVLCVLIFMFAVSCSDSKKKVDTDEEGVPDSDQTSQTTDEDSTESEDDSYVADETVEEDILPDKTTDEVPDEDAFPYKTCDPEADECGENEICIYVWAESDYFCMESCDDSSATPCGDNYLCEEVDGDDLKACFPPVSVAGQVFNLLATSLEPIENAEVVGMMNGSGLSTEKVLTDASGNYRLIFSIKRDRKGLPFTEDILKLSVAAEGYEQYPDIMRPSMPITFENVNCTVLFCNVSSGFSSVGLYPVDDLVPVYNIEGLVSDKSKGVLVIAECDSPPCRYAYTDENGNFRIMNVPAGIYDIKAYAVNLNYSSPEVTVVDADITGVTVDPLATDVSTLSGSVNIVNAPGDLKTSVVLMPSATFIESFAKGLMVPGLRAPDTGVEPDISGNYTISGIPDGEYYVLAAFENDYLVRDPDPNIAGTQIQKVSLPDPVEGYNLTIQNFKVTEAIEIFYPGAEAPEMISGNPDFSWKRDASATRYVVTVYNAQGIVIWEKEVPKTETETIVLTYDGPELRGFYQWIVVSYKVDNPISTSEDLRGVFYTNEAH